MIDQFHSSTDIIISGRSVPPREVHGAAWTLSAAPIFHG